MVHHTGLNARQVTAKPDDGRSFFDRSQGLKTVREIQGKLVADGLRVAFVVSRWNDFVVNRLLSGALDTFERLGGRLDDCAVVRVPGSFEIPLTVKTGPDLCLGSHRLPWGLGARRDAAL